MSFKCEGAGASGGEVGVEGFGELEIDGSAGREVQVVVAFEAEGVPLAWRSCFFAGDVQGIEARCAGIGKPEGVEAALTDEMDSVESDGHFLETGIAAKLNPM